MKKVSGAGRRTRGATSARSKDWMTGFDRYCRTARRTSGGEPRTSASMPRCHRHRPRRTRILFNRHARGQAWRSSTSTQPGLRISPSAAAKSSSSRLCVPKTLSELITRRNRLSCWN